MIKRFNLNLNWFEAGSTVELGKVLLVGEPESRTIALYKRTPSGKSWFYQFRAPLDIGGLNRIARLGMHLEKYHFKTVGHHGYKPNGQIKRPSATYITLIDGSSRARCDANRHPCTTTLHPCIYGAYACHHDTEYRVGDRMHARYTLCLPVALRASEALL